MVPTLSYALLCPFMLLPPLPPFFFLSPHYRILAYTMHGDLPAFFTRIRPRSHMELGAAVRNGGRGYRNNTSLTIPLTATTTFHHITIICTSKSR
jgi:hypothetical protein